MRDPNRLPGVWAVVPVKDIGVAKQRLASVLSGAERQCLFRAMLEDVLAALTATAGVAGVLVVTGDPAAVELAGAVGAEVLPERTNLGHTAAVAGAARELAASGASGMLTVPADLPLITSEEVERLLNHHQTAARRAAAMTIVPAHDELGSNAIACSPPDCMPLNFGDNSFYPHLTQARLRGMEPTVLNFPGIALDIDHPDDLVQFLSQPSDTHAFHYLEHHGILDRMLATKN